VEAQPRTADDHVAVVTGASSVRAMAEALAAAGAAVVLVARRAAALAEVKAITTLFAATCLSIPAPAAQRAGPPEGVHGFDPQLGSWRTHVHRLLKPLSGSKEWADYDGTTVTRPLLDGRANIAELKVAGPAGRIEGGSLRLYEPDTGRWTMNYFNVSNGRLTSPIWGTFRDGSATFEGDDTLGDKPIRVRFVVAPEGRDRFRFEQSFSADGGRTWELNWVATDTRIRLR
jgi:hypothetical protein